MGDVRYREAPRGYASALVVVGIFAIGFAIDAALGGAGAHYLAWLAALVVVGGIYLMVLSAARSQRTITLTDDELRVGEEAVPRDEIVGVQSEVEDNLTVVGMPLTNELPQGVAGLALHLREGTMVVIPTRFPERLAAALGMREEPIEVRPADEDDLQLLDDIADRADALFRVAGYELPELTITQEDLDEAKAIFVMGQPAFGFVLVSEADGNAHIDELAVVPARMRQGIGSALVEQACAWAAGAGYRAVTLITYSDVPWNRPFYERLGFVLTEQVTPDIAERRDFERTVGLDALGERIIMRKDL